MSRPLKVWLVGLVGYVLMRVWCASIRLRIVDPHGTLRAIGPGTPSIWAFWHNRLFLTAHMFRSFFPRHRGAALASVSKDGEIISALIERFGVQAVRGSSSRRGAAALVAMRRFLLSGHVVALTPDGPRGPVHRVNPGVVKLAQVTGIPIVPLHLRMESFWALRSWDGFRLPVPFSRVDVVFGAAHVVAATSTEEEFEAERLRFEQVLRAPEVESGSTQAPGISAEVV